MPPGDRMRKHPRSTEKGRITQGREEWVTLGNHEFVRYQHYDDFAINDEIVEQHLPMTTVAIRFPGRRAPVTLSLSHMTLPELEAFEEFLCRAIDKARPSCKRQDEIAQEAFDHGDDSYVRIYRPIPTIIVRQRRPDKHGAGLPSGPDGAADVERPVGDPDDRPGADGGQLPERDEDDVEAEDDRPQTGDLPDLR